MIKNFKQVPNKLLGTFLFVDRGEISIYSIRYFDEKHGKFDLTFPS